MNLLPWMPDIMAGNESPMHRPERKVLKWRLRSRIEARSLVLAFFWSPPSMIKDKARIFRGFCKMPTESNRVRILELLQ